LYNNRFVLRKTVSHTYSKIWGPNCSKSYICIPTIILNPYRPDNPVEIPNISTDFLPRQQCVQGDSGALPTTYPRISRVKTPTSKSLTHHPLSRFTNPSKSSTLEETSFNICQNLPRGLHNNLYFFRRSDLLRTQIIASQPSC
jgi:hypothetical protein